MQIRGATEDELGTLAELQKMVFRPGQVGAEARYRCYVEEDPSYRLEQSRVAVVDGRIAAHLRVWERSVLVEGVAVRAGGIGSLLTHPEFRGKGVASALLADTETWFGQSGYDIGLLFTIIGTPFYQARGWTPIPLPTFRLDPKRVPAEASGGGIRALDPEADLAAVARVYREASAGWTGPTVRRDDYWLCGPSRYRGVFPDYGSFVGTDLQGYVSTVENDDGFWVNEACGRVSTDWRGLARAILSRAGGTGRPVEGSLPDGHPLLGALAAESAADVVRSTHDEMMLKIANWESLSAKLGGRVALPETRPEGFPAEQTFWQGLFGVRGEGDDACVGPRVHYWWTDIF